MAKKTIYHAPMTDENNVPVGVIQKGAPMLCGCVWQEGATAVAGDPDMINCPECRILLAKKGLL